MSLGLGFFLCLIGLLGGAVSSCMESSRICIFQGIDGGRPSPGLEQFLNLSILDLLGWVIVVGDFPVHCRMFNSISGFNLLDVSRATTPFTVMTIKKLSLDIVQCPLGGKNHPWLRATGLEDSVRK